MRTSDYVLIWTCWQHRLRIILVWVVKMWDPFLPDGIKLKWTNLSAQLIVRWWDDNWPSFTRETIDTLSMLLQLASFELRLKHGRKTNITSFFFNNVISNNMSVYSVYNNEFNLKWCVNNYLTAQVLGCYPVWVSASIHSLNAHLILKRHF